MSYLEQLKSENTYQGEPPKHPKAAFGAFGSEGERHFPEKKAPVAVVALRDWVSGAVATATVATVATKPTPKARTVAGVATVAVAKTQNQAPVAVIDLATPDGSRAVTVAGGKARKLRSKSTLKSWEATMALRDWIYRFEEPAAAVPAVVAVQEPKNERKTAKTATTATASCCEAERRRPANDGMLVAMPKGCVLLKTQNNRRRTKNERARKVQGEHFGGH